MPQAVRGSHSAPVGLPQAVSGSRRSAPVGMSQAVRGSHSVPVGLPQAVSGSRRSAPVGMPQAVRGSHSAPVGLPQVACGSHHAPVGLLQAPHGSHSAPVGLPQAVSGSYRSAPAGTGPGAKWQSQKRPIRNFTAKTQGCRVAGKNRGFEGTTSHLAARAAHCRRSNTARCLRGKGNCVDQVENATDWLRVARRIQDARALIALGGAMAKLSEIDEQTVEERKTSVMSTVRHLIKLYSSGEGRLCTYVSAVANALAAHPGLLSAMFDDDATFKELADFVTAAAQDPKHFSDERHVTQIAAAQHKLGLYCPVFWQRLQQRGFRGLSARSVMLLMYYAGRLADTVAGPEPSDELWAGMQSAAKKCAKDGLVEVLRCVKFLFGVCISTQAARARSAGKQWTK